MKLGLLAAAWLGGLLIGQATELGVGVALLLAGSGTLLAVSLRLAQLPAFPTVLVVVLLLGMARGEDAQLDRRLVAEFAGHEITATGQIENHPERAGPGTRFELRVSEVQDDGAVTKADERWLVYAQPSIELIRRRQDPYFRYGDHVVVEGALREPKPFDGFDYPSYLAAQGITATLFAREASVSAEGGEGWRAALYSIRDALADSIERAVPYPESSLGQALLLGKRDSLPDELVQRFRGTGAAHLLAISGLHVGVLLAMIAGTGAWLLGRQRPTYLIVAAGAIWLYAMVAGASPSAVRAAVMGTLYLMALGLGRPSSVLPALALAAALMTVASPSLVRQVSFQLSFAAVAGIALAMSVVGGIAGAPQAPRTGWQARLLGGIALLAFVSGAASLATWPLVAANFGEVALLGIPVSVLAIPAMAPALVCTMAAGLAGLAFEPLGQFLGWIAVAPLAYLTGVVSVFPPWTLEAGWTGKPLLAGYYGVLGAALLAAQPNRTSRFRQGMANVAARIRSRFGKEVTNQGEDHSTEASGEMEPGLRLSSPFLLAATALALGIAAAILWTRAAGGNDGLLRVHFLDVGQGDSILVLAPSGRRALIDGGRDGNVVSQELAEALSEGDRKLDLIVVSHLDDDHSNGLLAVMDRYEVGAVLSGPLPADVDGADEWEKRLAKHDVARVEVSAGYVVELDGGVTLNVLNPPAGRLFGDPNNDSVAMRLTYGEVSYLLTGDMEIEAEEKLLGSGQEVESTVLKAGHHGSNTSTSEGFLEAVRPKIAIVSAGADNPYGHPSVEVMDRLESYMGEGNVFRTDLDGRIEVVSDGTAVWVVTER